ncbi:CARDB domain-containing protein [Natrinema sp. DC36]|uniref:CARDB domain-containing protein n=1 Tax=Natrinema sp. DC36 TaxID=2878680 RepID=UPI001CF02BBD|nr:CARDB domain-containing protein [Natrinema sp. DC36]
MPSNRVLLTAAAVCFLVALVVPTAAVTLGEDREVDDVFMEPTDSRYATVDGGELRLDLEKLNDRAITREDDIFTISVTDDDVERVWIENHVPGLTFYRGDDPTNTISRSNPLEPTPGSTTSIGVAVDTHDTVSGTETFTVVAQYEDEDEVETESDIDGSNLTVSSTNVEAGETVTVNATYRNNGDGWGTETARLTVDGTVVDRRTIALSSGEEETVSFERRMEWPGTYDVGIEGIGHQSVTVEGPQVEVSSATVDDATITAGETATVRATVRNPSDRSLERTLELSVDGIVVDTRTVSIPANGERTVTFQWRFAAAGTYEVAVSGVSAGTVTVEEPGPFSIQNRDLSAATTAALAPPATAGLLALAVVANRRWTVLR